MADSAPPRAKKAKRNAPISHVSAEQRAKQFKDDLYADGGVLFCKYCAHSVDYTRVDTIKDHLKSKKHCAKKCSQQSKETASGAVAGLSTSRQVTLSRIVKSKDLREEFVLDYIKLCMLTDIHLYKTDAVRPFLQKYCKQAGTLPQVSTLRNV